MKGSRIGNSKTVMKFFLVLINYSSFNDAQLLLNSIGVFFDNLELLISFDKVSTCHVIFKFQHELFIRISSQLTVAACQLL